MGRGVAAAATTPCADDEILDRGVQVDGGRARQGDGIRKRGHGSTDA